MEVNPVPSQGSADVKFEIGHVLFIDIVGYSKLLINEQSEQIQTLRKILRGTEQLRLAEAQGKLVRLPTGDGGALVFRNSPEAPVLCALEISKELKNHPELHVRMGIHSGPVNEITDLNEQANIAGAGINIAQRVMDCGDAGHILLSKRVADDLEHYPQWRSLLHELGECEVKHGARIGVVNFYSDEIGNSQIPKKLQVFKRGRSLTRWSAIAAGLLLLVGIVAAFEIVSKKSRRPASGVSEKSIAVLPFLNLSADKNDEYLSDGMTEELLNMLTRVKSLHVPGRSSSFAFKGKNEEDIFRKVGEQLHVNAVLEGSVRKAGDKLRITAQLINVADGFHLWSETYDRDMKDILAVQSDVARRVVEALQVQLGVEEARALTKKPTENPEAHRLYLLGRFHFAKGTFPSYADAIQFFNQAIQLDPAYALAYCGLADAYFRLSNVHFAPREVLPKAKEAALRAVEIDENLAEAHSSIGLVKVYYDHDWNGAESEFRKALRLNPVLISAHQRFGSYLTAKSTITRLSAPRCSPKATASPPIPTPKRCCTSTSRKASRAFPSSEACSRTPSGTPATAPCCWFATASAKNRSITPISPLASISAAS